MVPIVQPSSSYDKRLLKFHRLFSQYGRLKLIKTEFNIKTIFFKVTFKHFAEEFSNVHAC